MKTYLGTGSGGSAKKMVAEATKGLINPSLILTISPYNYLSDISTLLKEQYPAAQIIGTSGTSLSQGEVDDNKLILTAFYDDIIASCGIIEQVTTTPARALADIETHLNAVSPDKKNTVCIAFTTAGEELLVTTLNAVLEKKQINLIGGSVFGYPDTALAEVALNGKTYANACAYVFIKNKTGRIRVYKENLYEKATHSIHYVTKADPEHRKLIELDHQPALTVYCKEMGIPKDKAMDYVLTNPLGRVVDDDIFISSFASTNSDNTINMYKTLSQNDSIYILDLVDYETIIADTQNKMKADFPHISLIFSVDCIYRYLLFESKHYTKTYAKNFASFAPHVGVIGGGEQYNNQHVNQTMVCAVFE
ncbi:MAG: FIST N-terminal domain-containing protein [bacterium]|nr:FIST N-terminal domain-containing protein [bacterium]